MSKIIYLYGSKQRGGTVKSKNTIIYITIHNWEKYNPRKDVKQSHWLRFEHNFFEDPKFYDLSLEERAVWIYILCEVSKANGAINLPKSDINLPNGGINLPYFAINLPHAERVAGIPSLLLEKVLSRLEQYHILTRIPLRARNVRDRKRALRDETRRDVTRRDETDAQSVSDSDLKKLEPEPPFEFEKLYEKYPRKLGKKKGIERCEKEIRSQEEFQSLLEAIDRFSVYHAKQGTEPRYIPYFSTFLGSWRDWLDPDATKTEPLINTDYSYLDGL